MVFLGESHDDPTGHLLELEILRRMKEQGPVLLSLEMFETDVQPVVDEYLSGLITEEHLRASGRAWKNYKTDYRAMVEFAKEHHLPVVAANAPRRYVNRVSRLGAPALSELPAGAKAILPPLPYPRGCFGTLWQQVPRADAQDAGRAAEVDAERAIRSRQANRCCEARFSLEATATSGMPGPRDRQRHGALALSCSPAIQEVKPSRG